MPLAPLVNSGEYGSGGVSISNNLVSSRNIETASQAIVVATLIEFLVLLISWRVCTPRCFIQRVLRSFGAAFEISKVNLIQVKFSLDKITSKACGFVYLDSLCCLKGQLDKQLLGVRIQFIALMFIFFISVVSLQELRKSKSDLAGRKLVNMKHTGDNVTVDAMIKFETVFFRVLEQENCFTKCENSKNC